MRERRRLVRRLGLVAAAVGLMAVSFLPVSPASGFGYSRPPSLPSVVVGGFASCGLDASGNIYCWGDNVQSNGQAAPPAGQYTEVNLGYDTGCGLNSFGVIRCWGGNSATYPPPGGNYSHVSTGFGFYCAIGLSFGNISCWGLEDSGRISGAPTGNGFTQLSLGIRYGCALNGAGAITCWGDNTYGQLTVPAGLTASQITTGNFTTCAIKSSDSTVVCWGRDNGGQVSSVPSGQFTQINAGFNFVCGLRPDQTITCWGDNTYGQSTPPAGTYTMVSAGTFHACAMPTSGPPATCWGQNQAGRAVPQINDRLPNGSGGNSGTQAPPPGGAVGTPYNYQYLNTFMSPQGTYTLTAGSLPPGLTLSPTGQITGTPTAPGTYTGTVLVGNALSARSGQDSGQPITSTANFSITITGVGPTTTTTTIPVTTTTTTIPVTTTTTTIPATTTTTRPSTTTTTVPATTTTTRPATTTTTTVPSGPTCLGQRATLVGTEGNDRLFGTPGNDVIVGLGGNDSIYGLDGNDIICGGDGNDVIDGGAGNDILDGQAGDDRVIGGLGNDDVRGGDGNDRIFGSEGDNSLNGGTGFDYCYKGTGITTFTACEVYPAGM